MSNVMSGGNKMTTEKFNDIINRQKLRRGVWKGVKLAVIIKKGL